MFKSIIKPTLVLTIIAAIISGLLAVTYNITGVGNVSTAIPQEDLDSYTSTVLPGADTLSSVETQHDNEDFLGAYRANNGAGIAINLYAKGYNKQEPMNLLVGISAGGEVTGIAVISNSETPGLGSKVNDQVFIEQFIGANAEIVLSKNGGTIDAISGATISSQAFADGINNALDIYNDIKGDLQ